MSASTSRVYKNSQQSKETYLDCKFFDEPELDKLVKEEIVEPECPLNFVDVAAVVTDDIISHNSEHCNPLTVMLKTEFNVEIKEEAGDETDGQHKKDGCQSGQDSADDMLCVICKRFNKFLDNSFGQMSKTFCDSCHEKVWNESKSKWMNAVHNRLESCLICMNVFYNCLDFIDHDCTCEYYFRCKYCNVIFDKKVDIAKHLISCSNVLNDSSIELQDFVRIKLKESLNSKQHPNTHNSEKVFSLNICKKAFSDDGLLKKHARIHTGEKPFSCGVCEKSFSQAGHLNIHSRIHIGEKPYSCMVCKKSFSESSSLKRHARIHTGEKPFSCRVCKKSFSESYCLKKHARIHTGEKPFSCKVCKKSFSEAGSLKKHARIHTGEKPFSCKVCKKSFSEACNLKTHSRIHTGEKPFSCMVCKKSFSQAGNLKSHSRIHTR